MTSIWLSDLILLVVLLVTSEALYRAGRASRRRGDENVRSQVSTTQASTLGLLALFLGFTMSMAESRFTARRQIVVKEAAAVGTTYLRADILPEPVRSESKALLRDYVAARRDYFRASASEAPAATARAQAIHAALWSKMDSIVPEVVDSDVTALYVQSLNEMIDLEGIRDVAIVARLPWTIRFLLVLVAVITIGVTAYATGLGGQRVPLSLVLLPILIAFTVYVIIDLDRSRAGLITTGDLPMIRLQRTLVESPEGEGEASVHVTP
jgi:hypothetical protein